jgi:hypothetical protein
MADHDAEPGVSPTKLAPVTNATAGAFIENALDVVNRGDGRTVMIISNGNNRPDKKVMVLIGLNHAESLGLVEHRGPDHPENVVPGKSNE